MFWIRASGQREPLLKEPAARMDQHHGRDYSRVGSTAQSFRRGAEINHCELGTFLTGPTINTEIAQSRIF